MNVKQLVEWELTRETEVRGENMHQYNLTWHRTETFALGSRRVTA
jgi:hypothetical protein